MGKTKHEIKWENFERGKICVSRGQTDTDTPALANIQAAIKHRCAFKLIKYLWNCRTAENLL